MNLLLSLELVALVSALVVAVVNVTRRLHVGAGCEPGRGNQTAKVIDGYRVQCPSCGVPHPLPPELWPYYQTDDYILVWAAFRRFVCHECWSEADWRQRAAGMGKALVVYFTAALGRGAAIYLFGFAPVSVAVWIVLFVAGGSGFLAYSTKRRLAKQSWDYFDAKRDKLVMRDTTGEWLSHDLREARDMARL